MRYARPKPSIVLATVTAAVVAAPFAVLVAGSDPTPVDNSTEHKPTQIDQVSLAELPSMVLDVATSGLAQAGITLPPIDPRAFALPDISIPVPPGVLPTTRSSAPSASADEPSASTDPGSSAGSPTSSTPTTTGADPSGTATTTPTTTAPTTTTTPATTTADPGPRRTASAPADRGRSSNTTSSNKTSSSTAQPTPTLADGRPVGAAIKHIVRDAPIKMLAFTWDKDVDAQTLVRAKKPDAGWGPWTALEPVDAAGDPSADRPGGTEPIWVGDAREVQVAVTRAGQAIPAAEPQGGGAAQIGAGLADKVLGSLIETGLSTLKATLISPESLLSLGSSLLTPLAGGPQIVARSQWGADEGIRCSQPTFSPSMKAAVVHHTAGSNDYTREQSAEIVRGIYAYHARTLNWCDIGYNVLVDKYGQIFEGAFGGLERNVEGTHTGGFNKETVGVSMIGNLDQVAPSPEMVSSVGKFLRWRLGKANVPAGGNAQLRSEGFSASKFPAGATSNLPVISGHRDYNSTSCPGNLGYPALAQIRALAGGIPAPAPAPESPAPSPAPTDPAAPAPAAPAPGQAAPAATPVA
ncbi:peptidoglycan recognition protein family protein [Gordonia soli]|uniref:Peptidoglycan recognition protein family domain-containing protein n=1 Tax=Gordonia soli NBRC 108243 TaxID=1223545 RepID=M0QRB8_9ACTN|nr:N-acetylmuramoyl-L-alanine amidase [Gordonia soli]GAC70979.1 hypothetical protein GS4_45_00350 [Gordonia soli NBRC 108243]